MRPLFPHSGLRRETRVQWSCSFSGGCESIISEDLLAEQSKRKGVPISAELFVSVEAHQSPMQLSCLVSRLGVCFGLSSAKNFGMEFWADAR